MTTPAELAVGGEHLGSYDGRFLGVTLNISSIEQAHDLGLGVEGASPSEDDPQPLVRLMRETALAHEVKHYFDMLISPSGTENLLWRIDAQFQAWPALAQLGVLQDEGWLLPTPISNWCYMGADQRRAYSRQLAGLFGSQWSALQIPDIPTISPKEIMERPPTEKEIEAATPEQLTAIALKRVVSAYNRLNQILRYHPPPEGKDTVQPLHLHESSALLEQAAEATQLHTPEMGAQLLTTLFKGGHPYSLAVGKLLIASLRSETKFSPRQARIALAWAMFGDQTTDSGDRETTVYRYMELCQYVMNYGWPDGNRSVSETFSLFDRLFRRPCTMCGIRRKVDFFFDYLSALEISARRQETLQTPSGFGWDHETALAIFTKVAVAKSMAVQRFTENPDMFVDDLPRFAESLHPPIRIRSLVPGLIHAPVNDAQYWAHQYHIDPKGIKSVVSIAFDSAAEPIYSAREACRIYDELTFTDIIFSPFSRFFPEADLQTSRLLLKNVRLFTVLSGGSL